MGYYTAYNLEVYKLENEKLVILNNQSEIIKKIRGDESENIFYAIDDNGEACDEVKWYDHEEDMKIYSKIYPDFIFKLSGIGEENDDIWEKYFYNGKLQICPAIIKFDKFDINKLQ